MSLSAGAALGPYRIIERIGRGGMATVYKAHHPELDRFVAIKVLPDFFAEDETYRERFQQEARSVARLKHPNILSVFDFGQADGITYLVLELVEGGTLAQSLGSPMELEEVVRILQPLASALDHAHSQRILHRDIKPSNVLIQKDGTPVLADFGLARMAGSVRRLTASGTVMGTPEYMAPEQVVGEAIGPASDLYSFAVVAYEMLTGRVPFQGDTPGAVLLSHMKADMPPTRELVGKLSAHVEDALRKGLAKLPGDRYANASQFVAALTPAAWPSRTDLSAEDTGLAAQRQDATVGSLPLVLVVDDGIANRQLIEAYLADLDCQVKLAGDGPSALKIIECSQPSLVLLDVQMPGIDGYEVCRQIKARPRGRLLPVVMITSLDRTEDRVKALESGADDFMTKPVQRVELVARVRSALRLKAVYNTLDSAEHVIFALAAAVEARDPYTGKHTQRVAESARHLGIRLGLPEPALEVLYRGGIIHDIGKIGVPDAILLKPEPAPEESAQMRAHAVIGEGIVKPLRSGFNLLPIIRHHHEHFDGNGYPDGLREAAIPRLARIVAVCDAYDALVNDRPYRERRTVADAIATLKEGAGKQWDPEVVGLFTKEIANGTSPGAV